MKFLLLVLLSSVFICCSNKKETRKVSARELLTDEDVQQFVDARKGRSLEDVKSELWEADEQFVSSRGIIVVNYTLKVPATDLKVRKGSKGVMLCGFALRFKEGKLEGWDAEVTFLSDINKM